MPNAGRQVYGALSVGGNGVQLDVERDRQRRVVVPSGDTCDISGATITGSLTVNGGTFSLNNSTVDGNVAIENNAVNDTGGPMCGNTVGGTYGITNEGNNSTFWFGEFALGCAGGSIGGNVVENGNPAASLELDSVTVGGRINDTNKSDGGFNSPIDNELEGVTAQGHATCANNSPATVNDSASIDGSAQPNSFAAGTFGCPTAAS